MSTDTDHLAGIEVLDDAWLDDNPHHAVPALKNEGYWYSAEKVTELTTSYRAVVARNHQLLGHFASCGECSDCLDESGATELALAVRQYEERIQHEARRPLQVELDDLRAKLNATENLLRGLLDKLAAATARAERAEQER